MNQHTSDEGFESPQTPPPIALPEVRQGLLDDEALDDYSADLHAMATDIRCQVRQTNTPTGAAAPDATRSAPRPPLRVSLTEAIDKARGGAAVQIEYDHAGHRWRDTLMATNDGHKLVRMRMIQETP